MAGLVHIRREHIELAISSGKIFLRRLIQIAAKQECGVAVGQAQHNAVAVNRVRLRWLGVWVRLCHLMGIGEGLKFDRSGASGRQGTKHFYYEIITRVPKHQG